MQTAYRFGSLLLFLLSWLQPAVAGSPDGSKGDHAEQTDAIFAALHSNNAPGAAVLVLKDGRTRVLNVVATSMSTRQFPSERVVLRSHKELTERRCLHHDASPAALRVKCRPMIVFDCHLASASSDTIHVFFVQVAMNSGDNQGPDRDVSDRIGNLMRSIGKGPTKQIPAEELQKLKGAASRMDQMLKAAANTDQPALKSAAAKLDQLLSDIRAGKDVSSKLKRKENSET